jgi:hypothetical protein
MVMIISPKACDAVVGLAQLDLLNMVQREMGAARDRVTVDAVTQLGFAGEELLPLAVELTPRHARDLKRGVQPSLQERQSVVLSSLRKDTQEALIGFEQRNELQLLGLTSLPLDKSEGILVCK